MKLYLKETVWDAAHQRIARLYDEFDVVLVNTSGGKDSTVLLNIAINVAEEKGRLPLDVFFIDQESEWQAVIDYIRTVMHDPRVRPHWFQGPFRLSNSTSHQELWLNCWEPGGTWIRDKEPDSIHDNRLGVDRFGDIFEAFTDKTFPGLSVAQMSGVRAEESPSRLQGLTSYATYKDITWGRKYKNPRNFVFYPLYDWRLSDVWKAIHDNRWPYTRLYDLMYQYGVPINEMRVSSAHHETALRSVPFMQDIEPETWDALASRVAGINATARHEELYKVPRELPWMFRVPGDELQGWRDYRDHLLHNLIPDADVQEKMRKQFASNDLLFEDDVLIRLTKTQISAILINDFHMVKLKMFHAVNAGRLKRRGRISGRDWGN